MSFQGVGVDIVEIKRFKRAKSNAHARFISNVFSTHEQEYCRTFKDSAPHFAGTFAGKEAAAKALNGKYPLSAFEIRRTKNGKPEIWKSGKKISSLAVSLSHDGAYAVAVCIAR